MYNDFYGFDEIEVYVYDCEICKTTVKSPTIKECLVCKKRLCTNSGCNIGGICIIHYNMLSLEGKETLQRNLKEEKGDLKLYKHIFYGCMSLIGLLYFLLAIRFFISIRIERFEYVYDWELLLNLSYLGIGLFIWAMIVIIIYVVSITQKVKHNNKEKLKIFSKFSEKVY